MSNWHYEKVPAVFLVPYIVTVQEGFVICRCSGLSREPAVAIIQPNSGRYRNTTTCASP